MIWISAVSSEPVAPPRCTAKAAPMARKRPLLIFDSGVGGLSVLRPIRALLPTAPIVYAADNAGYPYGTKSEARSEEHTSELQSLMRNSYAVFCWKHKKIHTHNKQ